MFECGCIKIIKKNNIINNNEKNNYEEKKYGENYDLLVKYIKNKLSEYFDLKKFTANEMDIEQTYFDENYKTIFWIVTDIRDGIEKSILQTIEKQKKIKNFIKVEYEPTTTNSSKITKITKKSKKKIKKINIQIVENQKVVDEWIKYFVIVYHMDIHSKSDVMKANNFINCAINDSFIYKHIIHTVNQALVRSYENQIDNKKEKEIMKICKEKLGVYDENNEGLMEEYTILVETAKISMIIPKLNVIDVKWLIRYSPLHRYALKLIIYHLSSIDNIKIRHNNEKIEHLKEIRKYENSISAVHRYYITIKKIFDYIYKLYLTKEELNFSALDMCILQDVFGQKNIWKILYHNQINENKKKYLECESAIFLSEIEPSELLFGLDNEEEMMNNYDNNRIVKEYSTKLIKNKRITTTTDEAQYVDQNDVIYFKGSADVFKKAKLRFRIYTRKKLLKNKEMNLDELDENDFLNFTKNENEIKIKFNKLNVDEFVDLKVTYENTQYKFIIN